jgi:hypothetical protein
VLGVASLDGAMGRDLRTPRDAIAETRGNLFIGPAFDGHSRIDDARGAGSS